MPLVEDVIHGVEITHDGAWSQSHGAITQVAVLTKTPADKLFVEAVDLLEEGTIESHVESQNFGAVFATKQGSPFGFAVSAFQVVDLVRFFQFFIAAVTNKVLIQGSGGRFGQSIRAGDMKTAGAVLVDVSANKTGWGDTVPIREDQQL